MSGGSGQAQRFSFTSGLVGSESVIYVCEQSWVMDHFVYAAPCGNSMYCDGISQG
jgi:hypothetical protein